MIEYQEDGHRYFSVIDGRRREIPGVSAVLKSAGLIDDRWYKPGSAYKGQMIHRACTLYDEGVLDASTVDPEIAGYLDAWKKFQADTDCKIMGSEYTVGDEELGYAGRVDRRGMLKGFSSSLIIDLKSGTKAEWHQLQVAGYMRGEKYASQIKWQAILGGTLYLKKTGKYSFAPIKWQEAAALVGQFEGLVRQYHAKNLEPLW